MIKLVFMSNGYFGIPTLKYLIKKNKKIKINFIITSKKKKINNKLNFIRKIANKKKIKIIDSENLEDSKNINKIKKSYPDYLILMSFKIIKKEIWSIPKKGTINIHPSLLPNYKGPCPINWVIINNEKYTGLTSYFVNNNIDNGPIILQKKIKIKYNFNYNKLYNILSNKSVNFFKNTINIVNKNIKYKYAPKINNFYSKIDFFLKKNKIFKLILGLSSDKPAWCFLNTKDQINILNIYKINNKVKFYNKKNNIGKIIKFNNKILVKVIDGYIELLICQLNNRKKMKSIDLYNGLNNKKNIFLF